MNLLLLHTAVGLCKETKALFMQERKQNATASKLNPISKLLILDTICNGPIIRFSKSTPRLKLLTSTCRFTNPRYIEIYYLNIPFCQKLACGSSTSGRRLSPQFASKCIPTSCKSVAAFLKVFCTILFVLVISANAVVLGVVVKTDKLRNVPGYFKTHLDVADIMISAIVLPGMVYQNYAIYYGPLPCRVDYNGALKIYLYFRKITLTLWGFSHVYPFLSVFALCAWSVLTAISPSRDLTFTIKETASIKHEQ